MLTPPNQFNTTSNSDYINPLRTNYNEKFIKVLICHNFEIEVSSIPQNSQFCINLYVSPNIELIYKKSNGTTWLFDTIEEAWDFIDAHVEFNLSIILLELEKAFITLRHETEKDSEFQFVYHKLMNAREALGVFHTYQEVVNQNRYCSLTLNAKFKYCQDSFGGYGYFYCFTFYKDRMVYYVNFSSKDVSLFVDLNMSIAKIVKSMNILVVIDMTQAALKKALQTKVNSDTPELETARLNRIDSCYHFLQFLQEFS